MRLVGTATDYEGDTAAASQAPAGGRIANQRFTSTFEQSIPYDGDDAPYRLIHASGL